MGMAGVGSGRFENIFLLCKGRVVCRRPEDNGDGRKRRQFIDWNCKAEDVRGQCEGCQLRVRVAGVGSGRFEVGVSSGEKGAMWEEGMSVYQLELYC